MTLPDITARLNEMRKLREKATQGEYHSHDNYVVVETLDAERGKILAELFGSNPMYGDNCNDTEFYAHAANNWMTLITCLEKAVSALKCNESFHRLGGIDDCDPCKALTEISEMLKEWR